MPLRNLLAAGTHEKGSLSLLIAKRPSSSRVAFGQEARRLDDTTFDFVELLDHLHVCMRG